MTARMRGIDPVSCPDSDRSVVLQRPENEVGGVGHPKGPAHATWARGLIDGMQKAKRVPREAGPGAATRRPGEG